MISGRNVNYPDQIVSLCAMGLIIAALIHARKTGQGAHLDISQREVTTFLLGEVIGAAQNAPKSERRASRFGNADPSGGNRALLKSADGRWVAVNGPRTGPKVTDTMADSETKSASEIIQRARLAGAAAVPVLDGSEVFSIAMKGDDGCPVGRAFVGSPDETIVKGFPFESRRFPGCIYQTAPAIGRDNGDIMSYLDLPDRKAMK